ncbi:MAG: pilus assembly protein [Gammaproteobacteria bacterium]|nr:pilus assembly protein [Gammaproteobacteria bacterium]
MSARHSNASAAGFSLVEVMVAVIVISVGLLGIAKMQALALSSTGTARMRSIAALEAASLASAMHADRAYWSAITKIQTVNVTASTSGIAPTDATLVAPTGLCTFSAATTTPCATSAALAAVDLTYWAQDLNKTLPQNATALITCSAGTATAPVYCTIELDWTENVVALNTSTSTTATTAQTQAALTAVAKTQYILSVEP